MIIPARIETMSMRCGRTVPPAAAPLNLWDLVSGIAGIFGNGKTVQKFEDELREYYGVEYCFAVSSGKAALVLILDALRELSPGRDQVLIPAYTCYSVPSAIVKAGLKVRLCDMAHGSLDFDFECLEGHLRDPGVLCVIPTHLFGVPADVERVRELAGKYGVFVVEDAAQAMGGEWNGRKLGTLGDVGLFSMGRGKAFSTVEGGIILTDDARIGGAIGKRLDTLAGYGALGCLRLIFYSLALSVLIHPFLYWLPKSLPFLKLGETNFNPEFPMRRISPFQAGMARGWKAKITALRRIRLRNSQKIAGCGISLACDSKAVIPDLIRYPVLAADADKKRNILRESERLGLGISDGYPDSIDGIIDLGYQSNGKGFPIAKDIAKRLITLPVHPFVDERDIDKMARLLI